MTKLIGKKDHHPADETWDSQGSAEIERPDQTNIIAKQNQPEAEENKNSVENSDKSRDDMAIALQSAKASERQADYAQLSLWVGAIAALATAWAAWAAASAAKSAAASNEIARDTAKRELRAYLDVSITEVRNLEGIAEFMVEFKNAGHTPAYNVHGWGRLEMQPHTFDEVADESFFGDVSPGSNFHIIKTAPRQLTPEELDRVRGGRLEVYVYGEIRYKDAFGENHVTDYRRVIGYKDWISKYGKMGICQEGNSTS